MTTNNDVRLARMQRLDTDRDRSLTVTKLAYASAPEIFDVLRNPTLHTDFDPKQMIVSVDPSSADPITAVGDTFTMNMFAEARGGDYRMVNLVTEYESNRAIAWKPAMEGYPAIGFRWTWRLEPRDADSTFVSLTYDWLDVTHEGFLRKNTFPVFQPESFDASVDALVEFVEDDWGDESGEISTTPIPTVPRP
ncbi:SRPBCC family protein [Gulosibacter faecalis]|jgi:hypothetical protein|uniref:Polyketide cyclase n=1 Tax=Gulosibacter faecalis TaxID=272240 RepID=A0ABW5UWK8_9MICO|nr:hypothetical protein [Gulosibacter faecalis]